MEKPAFRSFLYRIVMPPLLGALGAVFALVYPALFSAFCAGATP